MTEQQPYDRSSKWLIQHHGDSILRLASITSSAGAQHKRRSCSRGSFPMDCWTCACAARIRTTCFYGKLRHFRSGGQPTNLVRDTMIVCLDRHELPEVIVLVLRPKGRYRIPTQSRLRSRRGYSSCTVRWTVIELWRLPAEKLLEAGDVGLTPWVMLADSALPPAKLAQRCRTAIEEQAPPEERQNFFAVLQVLARLRYNDPEVFAIFGGKQTMIESPLIHEVVAEAVAEAQHEMILKFLRSRFGKVPADLESQIRSVLDSERLSELGGVAGSCQNLDAFRQAL
ncbi:MAG: DUF4351 domain-containing protein [Planctomycetes bacterium]|nr:DUF4351 domain-containing protein [Planctomycetota bacterium]